MLNTIPPKTRTPRAPKSVTDTGSPIRRGAVTIGDVARAAGVTEAMVSMTLSGKRAGTPAANAVWRAARELDYQPNPHAQRLASGRCIGMVPVFSLYLDLGVGAQKIQTVQSLLTEAGMQAPLHTCGYGAHEGASGELMNDLRLQKPQAIVCDLQDLNAAAIAEIQRFIGGGGMAVTYDYAHDLPCDRVIFDREDNTYQAARHLLELGHTRIGLAHHAVFEDGHLSQRQLGFARALAGEGLDPHDEWNFCGRSGIDYIGGGREIARQFLALPVRKRPTALCIINDYAALSFITEVRRAGLSVPGDVSVVGHDDLPMVEHAAVPLTTAAHPAQEIARQAVALLRSRLDNSYSGPPREMVLRGELRVRQSTGPKQ